jgi:hypothetical protein
MPVSSAKVRNSVNSRHSAYLCEQTELAIEFLDAFLPDELRPVQTHEGRNP